MSPNLGDNPGGTLVSAALSALPEHRGAVDPGGAPLQTGACDPDPLDHFLALYSGPRPSCHPLASPGFLYPIAPSTLL